MEKRRLLLKACLKKIDEASLRTICQKAILTDTETDIIAMTCCRDHDIRYIADTLNVSQSTLQRKKMKAVEKLLFRLRIENHHSMDEIRTLEATVNSFKAEQGVINAQMISNISVMQNQIAVLNSLTKTVIPITNVCPEPMPLKNSWTAPTTSTTT